jgi:Ca2+-binding EF-hand superfamily protein
MSLFDRIFAKHDVRKDGQIDKQEFQKICYELGHYLSDDELDLAFTLLDSDGSGKIDRAELLNFWRSDDRFDRLQLSETQHTRLAQREFLVSPFPSLF